MCSKIKVGVTGGIGSGKSYVCRLIEKAGYPVFYTDTVARQEMVSNVELRDKLRALISLELYDAAGALDKRLVREFIQESRENAAAVNAAVHPFVRTRWREWAARQGNGMVFMECALLFEARFDNEVDFKLCVTASEAERVGRVMRRDGVPAATVGKWMAMQLSEDEKLRLCDFEVRNSGGDNVERQLETVIGKIREACAGN